MHIYLKEVIRGAYKVKDVRCSNIYIGEPKKLETA